MSKYRFYLPINQTKKAPVVITLPGIVNENERNKDTILEKLVEDHGIAGIRMNYPDITRSENGKLITCYFNLKNYMNAISETVSHILNSPKLYDSERIGVVASSISSGIFAHYLAQSTRRSEFKVLVTISPFTSWTDYGNEKIRNEIRKNGEEIYISSDNDRSNGVKRVIPASHLKRVKELDSLRALKNTPALSRPNATLTLTGEKDKVSNQDSMKEYHILMSSGKPNAKINFQNEGHNLPYNKTQPIIIDWITKYI